MKRIYYLLFVTIFISTLSAQIANERVVGGVAITNGEYPFFGFFVDIGEVDFQNEIKCGATLIHPNWLLTAAHCVDNSDNKIDGILNTGHLSNPWSYYERISIDSIIIHPDYSPSTTFSDIALLHLKSPSKIHPVSIATFLENELYLPYISTKVLGWGIIDTLTLEYLRPDRGYQADLIVLDSANCYPGENRLEHKREFCSGTLDGKAKGAAVGDSGSPLLSINKDGQWKQIGIVSRAGGGDYSHPGRPGIYTKVSYFSDWIKQMFNNYGDNVKQETIQEDRYMINNYKEKIIIQSLRHRSSPLQVQLFDLTGRLFFNNFYSPDIHYIEIEKSAQSNSILILAITEQSHREIHKFYSP